MIKKQTQQCILSLLLALNNPWVWKKEGTMKYWKNLRNYKNKLENINFKSWQLSSREIVWWRAHVTIYCRWHFSSKVLIFTGEQHKNVLAIITDVGRRHRINTDNNSDNINFKTIYHNFNLKEFTITFFTKHHHVLV